MSYKHLVGRLIETQRSMIGQRAVEIAQETNGISVTDGGNVTAVEGDREVVAALVDSYVGMLGGPAEARLRSAAEEFAEELVLPANLGGPEVMPDETPPGEEADTQEQIEAAVDGVIEPESEPAADDEPAADETEIEIQPARTDASPDTPDTHSPAENGDTGTAFVEAAIGGNSGASVAASVIQAENVQETEDALIVEYDLGSKTAEAAQAVEAGRAEDLSSVYMRTTDEHGWETPIAADVAIRQAVMRASGLPPAEIDLLGEYVDPTRVAAVLGPDGTIPVSFQVEGHNVTLHPNGNVRVH